MSARQPELVVVEWWWLKWLQVSQERQFVDEADACITSAAMETPANRVDSLG